MADAKLEIRAMNVLRRLRREHGSHCLFSLNLIRENLTPTENEVKKALDSLAQAGEVYKDGSHYRLN
jgi:hypothetical protein